MDYFNSKVKGRIQRRPPRRLAVGGVRCLPVFKVDGAPIPYHCFVCAQKTEHGTSAIGADREKQ